MKDYLIYFAQAYPNFRRAELESLANLYDVKVDLTHHDELSPFLVVKLKNDDDARKIVQRSILARGVYELWGLGLDPHSLHESVKSFPQERVYPYLESSFKFDFIGYMGSRSNKDKILLINTFSYLGFKGPVQMKNPNETFVVLEEYRVNGCTRASTPIRMWFGRQVQLSARSENILDKYDLKTRSYIGTTSFDAELSLISCNIAQVDHNKVTYDPFAGTGSFLVAAAHYKGIPIGSDIDPRILRGKGDDCNIKTNFVQYQTALQFLDVATMDFTHNALRENFAIDTIVCDPPYGVREGLKVCGAKNPERAKGRENVVIQGEKAHLRRDFIQPKKPYELGSLLADLLLFAAQRLPLNGRLAFWMPTANDDFEVNQIPQHEHLELVYNLEQEFNKWSRRLLVYVKRDETYSGTTSNGLKEANVAEFRNRYFNGFNQSSRQ